MRIRKLLHWKNFAILLSAILIIVIASVLLFKNRPPLLPDDMTAGDYSYAIEYSEYQIESAMKKYKIPGVVFAMVDGNEVIFSKAYGYADKENEIMATPDTIFKAGSISKVFTAIEVMRMSENGLIDIYNPITDYLRDFSINNRFNDSGPMTVESILTHRSGLPRNSTLILWDWSRRPMVLDAQVRFLSESYTAYPVNYRYKYSNTGYNILGRMIEVVHGLEPPSENTAGAFPYYMQDNFFNILGMSHTSFGSMPLMYGEQYTNPVAVGYYRDRGKNIAYNQFDIISMASGNVHTTLNDMITFVSILLAPDDNSFISSDMLDSMYYHQADISRDLKENGISWFRNNDVLGETVVFHDGTNQGFISMLAMVPEHGLGIVMMANSDEFENVKSSLSFDILRVMLESKTGTSIPAAEEPDTVSVGDDTLVKYTGSYLMNDEKIEIFMKKGSLKAKYGGFSLKLHPIDETTFKINNPLDDSIQTRVTFYPENDIEYKYMILEMGDSFFCPCYPVEEIIPESWEQLVGTYTRYARHTSDYVDAESMGKIDIKFRNGILMMEDSFAILPADDTNIEIRGGVFHGETMEYEPESGEITWQSYVYKPD